MKLLLFAMAGVLAGCLCSIILLTKKTDVPAKKVEEVEYKRPFTKGFFLIAKKTRFMITQNEAERITLLKPSDSISFRSFDGSYFVLNGIDEMSVQAIYYDANGRFVPADMIPKEEPK